MLDISGAESESPEWANLSSCQKVVQELFQPTGQACGVAGCALSSLSLSTSTPLSLPAFLPSFLPLFFSPFPPFPLLCKIKPPIEHPVLLWDNFE